MRVEDGILETNYASPELRLLKARRIFKLFRLSMILGLLAGLIGLIWLASPQLLYGSPLLYSIREMAPIYALAVTTIFLGSLVPLQLEIGVSPRRWAFIYRDSRWALDENKARQLEEESIVKRKAGANPPQDEYIKDTIEAPMSLIEMHEAADTRETDRWKSSNYPALTRSIIERLRSEIDTQGSRANINLGIALIVASVGVLILGWLSWNVANMISAPPPKSDYSVMLYTGAFTAKLALALSANVFAFFFLSTYRRNLSEIRYFHNELTNVQTRVLALYVAADLKVDSSLALAIKGLSSTERNFILKKGESTTDQSLKNLDATEVATLTALFKEMVQATRTK